MNGIYVVIGVVGFVLICIIFGSDYLPKAYLHRKCMGSKWKKAFPNSPKAEIREFLLIFSDAFAFAPKHRLKFGPEDKVLEIYRGIYPSKNVPDVMEIETFSLFLEQEYDFKLEKIWSENTSLGEVYAAIKNA